MDAKQFRCAGFFVVDVTGTKILLGSNKREYLSAQKGKIEKTDKSLFDAAARETFEESGIELKELMFSSNEYIEYSDTGKPNIFYYLAKLKQERDTFQFNPKELTSVEWYSIRKLMESLPKELKVTRLRILDQIEKDLTNMTWMDNVKEKYSFGKEIPINEFDKESRMLVKILRHQLEKLRLEHNASGYVKLKDIFSLKQCQYFNLPMIQKIIHYDATYDKKRMDLIFEDNHFMIRANQGHSLTGNIKQDEIFQEIKEAYPICCHGTKKKFLKSIYSQGLSKMGRTHIHCVFVDPKSPEFKEILSGFKIQSDCYIKIDMAKYMADGNLFFMAKNGVGLTTGPILPKYFLSSEDI